MALTGAQEEVWFCASKWASRPASPWLRAKPGRIWSYSRLFSWAFEFILSEKCQYDTPEIHEFNNVKMGFPLRKDTLVETEFKMSIYLGIWYISFLNFSTHWWMLKFNMIQQLSLSLTTFEYQMFHLSWEIWFNYSELLKKHLVQERVFT